MLRLTGGSFGLMRTTGIYNTRIRRRHILRARRRYHRRPSPGSRSSIRCRAERRRPRHGVAAMAGLVSGWFPFVLGGAVALLAITLVVSPAAFVYERRLIARERVQEEMARMRRDAHDKVYNRLSALSKRVAAAGDELSASTAALPRRHRRGHPRHRGRAAGDPGRRGRARRQRADQRATRRADRRRVSGAGRPAGRRGAPRSPTTRS